MVELIPSEVAEGYAVEGIEDKRFAISSASP
jgi:hypothetical protein